jgi:tetratricopeptide (TPR) repeat protein
MTDQSLRNLFVGLCCAALGMIACNVNGNGKDAERAAILTHPPYAPLTDSIERQQGSDRAGLFFRRAELLSHNDQHELAAADYSQAWNLKPDEMTGARYASTLTITGETAKAIRFLQECHRNFPGNTTFPAMLAELYTQSNRMEDAIGIYDNILQTDSLNFDAWYEKGLLLEKKGDTISAIAALKKAYRIQPVNTYGLELALLYAEHRDPSAVPVCDAILLKDSARDLPDPFLIKGIYFSNTAQYKKAIIQFDSCIGRDWKFADAYREKGIALYKQKQYDSAMRCFQMTVRVQETDADGYFWIGRCYEATGNKENAISYYRQALSLDKNFTEAAAAIKRLQ